VEGQTRSIDAFTFYLHVHHQLLPETEDWARWTSGLTQSMNSYTDMCKLVFLAKFCSSRQKLLGLEKENK